MNRREALAALVALPEVARIGTVPAHSTDVLVVECDEPVSSVAIEHIKKQLGDVWPDRRIVVLGGKGLRLKLAPK